MKRAPLVTLAILALPACAAQTTATTAPTQAPTASADTTDDDAEAPPAAAVLDDSPAMSLDAWRTISEEGQAAARVADLGERIETCKRFVAKHGAHKETTKVLESLADAMVESGSYDSAEYQATGTSADLLPNEDDFPMAPPAAPVPAFCKS